MKDIIQPRINQEGFKLVRVENEEDHSLRGIEFFVCRVRLRLWRAFGMQSGIPLSTAFKTKNKVLVHMEDKITNLTEDQVKRTIEKDSRLARENREKGLATIQSPSVILRKRKV